MYTHQSEAASPLEHDRTSLKTKETSVPVSIQDVWERVSSRLRASFGVQVFESWFASARIDESHSTGSVVCLSVANAFLARQINLPLYFPTLQAVFNEEMGNHVVVKVSVRSRTLNGTKIHDPEASFKRIQREVLTPSVPLRKQDTPEVVTVVLADNTADDLKLSDLDNLTRRLFMKFQGLRIKLIIEMMAQLHNVSVEDVMSTRRNRRYVIPRHIGMYLARMLTTRSLPEIGEQFAGHDHSSVLHGIRKIQKRCKVDTEFREQMQLYIETINKWRPQT